MSVQENLVPLPCMELTEKFGVGQSETDKKIPLLLKKKLGWRMHLSCVQ